jgi:hypothetical protein
MLSRNNLLSTGEPNMVPTQDMVLDVILTTFDQRRKLNLQNDLNLNIILTNPIVKHCDKRIVNLNLFMRNTL